MLYDNFVKSVIDLNKFSDFMAYSCNIVSVNGYEVDQWLKGQPAGVDSMIDSSVVLGERPFNVFNFMIKRAQKPPTEVSALDKYGALQTVVYNDKTSNVVMCPVVNMVRDRLIAVLKPNVLLYSGMSPNEFNELLSKVCDLMDSSLDSVENDFSKYDKSQLEFVYWFEYYLYSALGMDPYLLDIYMNAHATSRVYDSKHGLGMKLNWQRRSGGATTWLGNTLFALAVLVAVYDIDKLELVLAGGDDSVLFGHNLRDAKASAFADMFNLEAKILNYRIPYFCSKFILRVDDRVVMVPDPIKFITKLGRKDIRNYEHLEEYRVSCLDNYSMYADQSLYRYLSDAVIERYKLPLSSVEHIFPVLYSYLSSPVNFEKLFIVENPDLINWSNHMMKKFE